MNCWNEKLETFVIENKPVEFEKLVRRVNRKALSFGLTPVYGLENAYGHGRSLAVFLLEKGCIVKDVNPALAYDRRRSAPTMKKNDEYDAYCVAMVLTCSSDDFYKYLIKINSEYADTYVKTGKWPSDVQIPKSPDVLKVDGSIDWSKSPKGGYVLDSNGEAIKTPQVPGIGEIIDRNGPPTGRYVSPVANNKPFSYDMRSLPYVEDPSSYHRYQVVGDLTRIKMNTINNFQSNDMYRGRL